MRTKKTKRTGRLGKRAGESGKGKPDKSLHTQDFIPIKDIRNGIIETADGRYVKIVEVEPINFLLRSPEEQWGIISSFTSWLKISPVKLQFKSISRKADSDKHIASVERDLLREENGQCERLAREYIGLIRDVGSKEALTRRFSLCFEYEALPGRRGSDSYADIHAALQNAVQNAKTYFLKCGNAIRQSEDENAFVAEVLYVFFNRHSCAGESFAARVERVVVDAMRARRLTIGKDPVPGIPAVDFIAPRGLDLTHYNYTVMDGTYYTFLYIRRNGYPNAVRAGWMSALINAGEGVDVDIHLRRENRGRTLDKVSQRIRLNRSKMRSVHNSFFRDVKKRCRTAALLDSR